jgi:prepilin-type N-terminal cleavage/methylation domain-containing protein
MNRLNLTQINRMNSRTTLRFRHACAFTLIELLVVISIIAMLATLLFPVTGKIMDQMADAKCANNMRQIGMIIQTAATDDNGTYPNIENDPQNPIHKAEDGKVWTLSELMKARGASAEIVKCPADLRAKLYNPKDSGKPTSYVEAKGSSYEWYPLYEGENVNAPRRFGFDSARTLPPSRVRLLMDYAESGEAPHDRSSESSSMHSLYADGSVRTIVIPKEK